MYSVSVFCSQDNEVGSQQGKFSDDDDDDDDKNREDDNDNFGGDYDNDNDFGAYFPGAVSTCTYIHTYT